MTAVNDNITPASPDTREADIRAEAWNQFQRLVAAPDTMALIRAYPHFAIIMNQHQRIIACNANVLKISGAATIEDLIGRRPGEALNCVHVDHGQGGGCGSTDYCIRCSGALAQQNLSDMTCSGDSLPAMECRLTLRGAEDTVVDLAATATPVVLQGQTYILFALRDVSGEKRRELLEQIFFHDMCSSLGGLYGLSSLLLESTSLSDSLEHDYKDWLATLAANLLDDVRVQRKLLDAELGTFIPDISSVSVTALLTDITRLYLHHEKTPGRTMCLVEPPECYVTTDISIMRRILGNMVMNALEASPSGGVVTLAASCGQGNVTITVHNQGEIPQAIQDQLFKRSFSTKSFSGRGLGTYSMKLFGERYLKGLVSFTSTREEGTTFSFTLPLETE